MPGCLALVDFEARADLRPRFARMQAASRLMPWYRLEGWHDPLGRVAIGRADLGVLNAGPQPVASQDGRWRLFLQGELSDRPRRLAELEARGVPITGRDNADLLLAAYRADGLAGIARLNGSFFFVLWDGEAGELLVGGDRHGNRPHLYAFHQGRFLLAPDLAGLVAARGGAPGYDLRGLAELLALEYPLADRTPFAGVKAFPGGTVLRLGPHGARWQPYWRPRFSGEAEASPRVADYLDEALHLYRQAVRRSLEGDVVVPLSGGTDSRTIVALAGDADFPVFTFGDEGSEDVRYARRVAAASGHAHHFLPLRDDYLAHHAERLIRWGDGMVSLFHAHDCDGLEEIRELAPVAVYGMTAEFCRLESIDNLLAREPATRAERLALLARHVREGRRPLAQFADEAALQRRLVERAWCCLTPALAGELLTPAFARQLREAVEAGLAETLAAVDGPTLEDRLTTWNLLNRQRRFTQWGLKVAGVLVEGRKPFDDYDLVNFLLTVPAATRRKLLTAVLNAASPRLASIPRTGYGAPPNAGFPRRAAAYAKKHLKACWRPTRVQSFADPQAALRAHAAGAFERLFAEALPEELVRPQSARALLRSHLAGETDAASALCALGTLAMLGETYRPSLTGDLAA